MDPNTMTLGNDEPLTEIVDARMNPDMANAMAAQALGEDTDSKTRDLPAPPAPPAPAADTVTLPSGSVAVVRELTGADEEKMARIPAKDFIWRQRDAITRAGLVSLDGEPVDPKNFPDLIIADREALLLAIRIATYGHELDMSINCPQCATPNDVTVDLSEIKVGDVTAPSNTVTLRDGTTLTIAVIRASDEDDAFKMAVSNRTGAEMNTRLIAECVVGTDGGVWMGEQSAKALGLGDRKKVLETILDKNVGPQYDDLEAECAECGHRASLDVSLADMFRG